MLAMAGAAQAQNALAPSEPLDNISLTVKGGVVAPINNRGTHLKMTENFRGMGGLELRKQLTPTFGLGVEGEVAANTSTWNHGRSLHNWIDAQYVGVFGAVNLNNLFAGYAGQPRTFEVEAVAGSGWIHYYVPKDQGKDGNEVGTKFGLNFNFNLGESKAWTIGIKPAVIFDLTGQNDRGLTKQTGALELQAGITYHFGNSNGTHSFAYMPVPDFTPFNDAINALRAENATLMAANADVVAANAALAAQLDACMNQPAPVVTKTVVETNNSLESVRYIYYRLGSAAITPDQLPNVEMIADYMKANPASTVEIKGYASQDGNLDFNIKLAAQRAQSVKNMLVSKYGIKADRIKAEGQGVGHMFKENSWNRVAICILSDK